jgi:hypothetical protein
VADHVLVVGNDGFQNGIRLFIERRGATSPSDATVTNVQRFVKHLNDTIPAAARPVGHVYIGSHASPDGWMDIDFDDEAPGDTPSAHTSVDDLIAAKLSGSVKFKAGTLGPTSEVRIRGCEVGRSTKFMTALHDAFGAATVVAPKFFDVVGSVMYTPVSADTASDIGSLEFFQYAFLIRRLSRYANRAAALADFRAKTATFRFIDEAPVPASAWDKWLPAQVHDIWTYDGPDQMIGTRSKPEKLSKRVLDMDSWDCTPGIMYYRQEVSIVLKPKAGDDPASPTPALADVAAMRAYAKTILPNIDPYKSTYLIPAYEDFGFTTLNNFIDGVNWRVDIVNAATGLRHLVAFLYNYTVMAPVMDRATNRLMYNFETADSTVVASHVGVLETNTDFFARA